MFPSGEKLNMRKPFILIVVVIISVVGFRYLSELRARSIATEQVLKYENEIGLSSQMTPIPDSHNLGLITSIFDYNLYEGSIIHRIRIYVDIFGHFERHVLAE